MLFGFGDIVADLSRLVTLEPGDVILTGTPTGSTVVNPATWWRSRSARGRTLSSPRAGCAARSPRRTTASTRPVPCPAPTPPNALPPSALRAGPPSALRGDCRWFPAIRPDPGRAAQVSTATLAALLRKRGLNGLTLDGLRSTHPRAKMAGYARTVRYLPLREDLSAAYGAGMNAQKRAIEEIRPGEVLVIEARGDPTAGTIGDILGLRAQVRGAVGIVTDGAIRDSVALAGLEIPVYHAAVHPAVLGRRHVPWETGVTVACAGVTIQPGDILVGDADGVVVLPPPSRPRSSPKPRNRSARRSSSPPASRWANPSTDCSPSATPAVPTTKPGSPSNRPPRPRRRGMTPATTQPMLLVQVMVSEHTARPATRAAENG